MQSEIQIKDEVLPRLHELWEEIANFTIDENSFREETTFIEGTEKIIYTTKYEEDPEVRKAFLKGKQLKCEVCGFDFEEVYGPLGRDYIEIHHKKPIHKKPISEYKPDLDNDFVMLCTNCHRMIHRGKDHMITVEELKEIIKSCH